jgi:hypothetical protein
MVALPDGIQFLAATVCSQSRESDEYLLSADRSALVGHFRECALDEGITKIDPHARSFQQNCFATN